MDERAAARPALGYPLAYGVRWTWRALLLLYPVAALLVLGHAILRSVGGMELVFAVCVLVPVGIAAGRYAVFGKLTVSEDGVSVRDAFWTRTLRTQDILGDRIRPGNYCDYLWLASRSENGGDPPRSFRFALVFDVDAAFRKWLQGFQNLDQLSPTQSADLARDFVERNPPPVPIARNDDA